MMARVRVECSQFNGLDDTEGKHQFTPQELDYPDSGRPGCPSSPKRTKTFPFTKSGSVVTWDDSLGETFPFQRRRIGKEKLFSSATGPSAG